MNNKTVWNSVSVTGVVLRYNINQMNNRTNLKVVLSITQVKE